MRKHIAVFPKEEVEAILAGGKTIDMRVSAKKVTPFGEVSVGDIVFIKSPGLDVSGQYTVKKVIYIEGFEPEDLKLFEKDLKAGNANFASIIYMKNVKQLITSPVDIDKKSKKSWVIL